MGIAQIVYHYLITTHHGSHYDWHVWDNWALYLDRHGWSQPPQAVKRVLALLAKGGI
jgi:hypothetical protein